jgi:tRNA pseudouridine55 synthase
MVEIPTRNVVIHQLELLQYDDVKKQARFFVHCSKGTYVRSICHDLGEVLGCGGVMAGLVRTSCGAMNLEEAVTFEELESDKDFREHLVSMEKPLVRLGWIVAHPFQERALEDGKSILVGKNIITPPSVIGKHPIKYGVLVEGRLAAIGTVKEDRFRPEKVFKKRGMDI